MDAKVPLITKRNFKPGFRISLHSKDLANALQPWICRFHCH